jgi:hypothetical protein
LASSWQEVVKECAEDVFAGSAWDIVDPQAQER